MTTKKDIFGLLYGILIALMIYVGPVMLVGGLLYGILTTVFYTTDLKIYDGPVDCFVMNLTIDNEPCTREDNLQKCYDIHWKVNVKGNLEYIGYISSGEIDDEDQVESLTSEHNINTTSECWYKVDRPKSLRWTKYIPDPIHVIISWSITGVGLLLILIVLGTWYGTERDHTAIREEAQDSGESE